MIYDYTKLTPTLLCFSVGKPSQPNNLTAVADSTTVTVSWSTNFNDSIYDYTLQYNYTIRECQNRSFNMSITIDSHSNNYTLTNLEEDSDLTISLLASNPAGSSEEVVVNTATLQSG